MRATIARHSSRIPGPPARWMAPSTPPPPRSPGLAALTMASASSRVMSPWTRTSLVPPTVISGTPRASAADERPALLAHELGDIVRSARGLARRAAPLPAAERVDAGPGAGGGAGTAVDVHHPRLDAIEELLDLLVVGREQPGGETVVAAVRQVERIVERAELPQAGERQEHLVVHEPMVLGETADDRRLHEEAVGVRLPLERLAARQDLAVLPADLDELRVLVAGGPV